MLCAVVVGDVELVGVVCVFGYGVDDLLEDVGGDVFGGHVRSGSWVVWSWWSLM